MEDAAEQCGFQVIAAVAAIAEHSIVRQYASGRPNIDDYTQLAEFAETIKEKLDNGNNTKPIIPGNRPYKEAPKATLMPEANSDCTNCGLCAKKCPSQAIDPQKIETGDSEKCISCMRCEYICPHHARKLNSAITSAVSLLLQKACVEIKQNELFI